MDGNQILNGRYELVRLLGRGGMADVYLGHDSRLGREVAIKLLRRDLARDPQFQARFRREAQAVAGLNHPSIVAVYDTGEAVPELESPEPTRLPYIVMEYVEGKTLRDLIKSKSISIDQAVDYTLGILSALEYSHRAGIVHRDIKPANVMVTEDGTGIKVMDFGIARAIADSAATMTQTQAVVGTAQYLSPEQALGENVDARSDIYSCACLLFEMLTGRPPFIGDSPVSVVYQHVREPAEAPSVFNPEVSPQLDQVVLKALQKERSKRFQDAASFRRSLRAAKAGVSLGVDASTGNTDEITPQPLPAPAPKFSVTASPAEDALDDNPPTRAMAKILGGPLTTGEPADTPPDEHPINQMYASPGPDRTTVRRRRGVMITLMILVLALLLGGGYALYNYYSTQNAKPAQVQVPSVANESEADALSAMYDAGLKPKSVPQFSDTVASGKVINSNPAAGTTVRVGSSVDLNVSKGPSSATVPKNLEGMTESSARDAIRSANLQPGNTTMVDDPTMPAGQVVSTDPAPGTSVAAGSTVNLNVSTGQVKIPALFGKTKDEVQSLLKSAAPKLIVTYKEKENSQAVPGTVIDQDPQPDADVDQNSSITVTLAKSPPTPTPTPSPSPSATPTSTAPKTN